MSNIPNTCLWHSFAATWVGGGLLMAMTEMVYDPEMGLIWALMPVQYSVSFIIGKSDNGRECCRCFTVAGKAGRDGRNPPSNQAWECHIHLFPCEKPSEDFKPLHSSRSTWANRRINSVLFATGGLFFAKPMRERKYITMMDPFQSSYGNVLSAFLVLPALMADVLWVACTLFSLGKTSFKLSELEMRLPRFHTSVFAFPTDRSNAECDPGFALRLYCLDLSSRCHYLHTHGRPVLRGLHGCHPARRRRRQSGEGLCFRMYTNW